MAWSDAARKAALEVRRARSKGDYNQGYRTYHTGNVGGKLFKTDRPSLAFKIRAMRRGAMIVNPQLLATARVSTDFRNYRKTGRMSPRLKTAMSADQKRFSRRRDQAYEDSIKSGYNAGKKRGGFF
jgi:hypothetical protein